MAGAVAYLMSRFPHLPETFILREMTELERQGLTVRLYPLIRQRQSVVHEEARAWLPRAADLSLARSGGALLRAAFRQPVTLLRTWLRVVAGNASSPAFLVRAMVLFPKAVLAAESIRRAGVGHVHAHYATHPALAAWIVHRLTGIPYSVTAHAHDIFVDRAMLRAKVEEAAFVVAISEFNRDFLIRHLGPGVAEKIAVIHCGVDPEKYRPRPTGPASGRLELLTIASLQPYKGLTHLVQACAELRARGVRFRSRIVGEGAERPRLEKLIAALGLNGDVELLGALPQEAVQRLLPEADCYVQPSVITPSGKMEGIPVSIMEALACEVPVVATAISGIPELVEDGVTGRLVPPANPQALAAALIEAARERTACRGQARAGRARVLEQFDVRRNVARLAELLGSPARADGVGDLARPAAPELEGATRV